MACHRCNDSGEVWLEDESTKKGGLWVPCRRCHCTECGGELSGAWGECPKGCDNKQPECSKPEERDGRFCATDECDGCAKRVEESEAEARREWAAMSPEQRDPARYAREIYEAHGLSAVRRFWRNTP